MESKQELQVQLRWLIRRDMPEVLAIENDVFSISWTEEDFLCAMRQRNCIGMVAEHDRKIVGFMIYELHKMKIYIINFAVSSNEQRKGIGRQMIKRLVEKLIEQKRKVITLETKESNLKAQLFFSSQGFKAKRILKEHYVSNGSFEDAYFMEYSLRDEKIPMELSERNLMGK